MGTAVRVEVGVGVNVRVGVEEGVGDGLNVADGLAVSVAEGVAVGGGGEREEVEGGRGEAVAVEVGGGVASKAPGAHAADRLSSASFRKSRRESLLPLDSNLRLCLQFRCDRFRLRMLHQVVGNRRFLLGGAQTGRGLGGGFNPRLIFRLLEHSERQ